MANLIRRLVDDDLDGFGPEAIRRNDPRPDVMGGGDGIHISYWRQMAPIPDDAFLDFPRSIMRDIIRAERAGRLQLLAPTVPLIIQEPIAAPWINRINRIINMPNAGPDLGDHDVPEPDRGHHGVPAPDLGNHDVPAQNLGDPDDALEPEPEPLRRSLCRRMCDLFLACVPCHKNRQ